MPFFFNDTSPTLAALALRRMTRHCFAWLLLSPCFASAVAPAACSHTLCNNTTPRALQHPCLVLFLGASISTTMCMVSEFMEGGSLFGLLYKQRHIPSASVRLTMARDIAQAMAYLHNCKPPIVHRDLKSLNILVSLGVLARLLTITRSLSLARSPPPRPPPLAPWHA